MSLENYAEDTISSGKAAIKNWIKGKIIKCGIIIGIGILIFILAFSLITGVAGDNNGATIGEELTTASTESWNQFIRYLHQAEGGGTIYKNGSGVNCYKVNSDGGGGLAVGYGVDIATHGLFLRVLGYSTTEGSLIPVTIVDAIEKKEIEARYSDIENLATSNGITLTVYQKFALTSRTYNYGMAGGTGLATGSFQYPSTLTFVQAYKKYYKVSDDNYGDYSKTDLNNGLYVNYMTALKYKSGGQPEGWVTRRKSEWCLFQTGYFGWGLKNGGAYPAGFDEYCNLVASSATEGPYTGTTFNDSTGKTYKLYKQGSDEYKNVPYPARGSGATIGKNGCGPTSCAIIASAYGYTDTPKTIVNTGKCYSCAGDIVSYFNNKGFSATNKGSLSDSEIKKLLGEGYDIVILIKSGGKIGNYTLGVNHWITLLDVDSDGKVFIGDPVNSGGGWFYITNITNKTNCICVKK